MPPPWNPYGFEEIRGPEMEALSRGKLDLNRLDSSSWNGPEMIAAFFGRERKVRTPNGSMPGESRGVPL